MRKLIFLLLSVVLVGCNDRKSTTTTSSDVNGQDTISSEMPPPGNIQEERDAVQTERAEPVQPEIAANLDGRYRKIVDGKAATDCNCDCIEIDFDKPTEWCIDKDKLYITAQTRKSGENTADLFFISASREIEPDRALPWDDFDKNIPIATLVFTPDGGVELDWLGFSTNGEVATDYALYGKKTLEGTYKKE
ncbi:hypothetical protein [Salinimicrobium xinjiangense]|uniref:hypothetical protein n=1 Tax=Salinimicrobium xinjiangense TaxID=438596 RepID=UPI000426955C|nr:hypothetical protein [Salinimicrobium xinjiangense]